MTLKELGPDLYRENAFRITGLPVRATARDIRRHADKQRLLKTLGKAGTNDGMLPPGRPFDEGAGQRAAQRLKDPVARLVDELFWPWPISDDGTDDGTDEGMAALVEGRPHDALRVWERTAAPAARTVAVHNIAVLSHVRALDADGLDEETARLWKRAYTSWAEVIADDAFWDLMRARAKELDDPRLSAATVRALREELPSALLSISAQLAATAARESRSGEARGHIGGMLASGFASGLIDLALRDAVEHERARIKSLCENAQQGLKADPGQGYEAAERFLGEAGPLLDVITGLLPEDDWAVRHAGEDIALTVLYCVVAQVNKTKEYRRALELLEPALDLAATESARDRIQGNIDTIRDNLSYACCFLCGKDAEDGCEQKVPMHGEVNRELTEYFQTRITWRTLTISVPRCRGCRTRRGWRIATGVLFVPWAVFTLIAVVAGAAEAGAVLVAIGILMAGWLIAGTRRSVTEFGPILDLVEKGWARGARPPEARS
ncbi:hypothetical protein AB0I81_02485 [Nonomuraea sp. NPDC050404]|uniref:hypothetical protein n=1 Tax=Nonomuraea sp. NPDC050404 TaxID=3155783 RepID=UPI0033FD2A98